MNADELKTLTASALDSLTAALEQGHSETLTALLKTMGRFHRYSLRNVWLIAAQCPTATQVAGFQTWKTLKRCVRRGEKGIAILAPIVRHRHATDALDDESLVGFRAAYVFDIAQTDGDQLPELAESVGDPGASMERLRIAIVERGISIEVALNLGGALGTSSGGRIQILAGLAPATAFVTLVHEFAHELLHRGTDSPGSRDTRELEAEAVAFVVSHAIGLDAVDSARDYIHLYRGDRAALAESLDRIQSTAATILGAVSGPRLLLGGSDGSSANDGKRQENTGSNYPRGTHFACTSHLASGGTAISGAVYAFDPPTGHGISRATGSKTRTDLQSHALTGGGQ